jgi:acetyl esterase
MTDAGEPLYKLIAQIRKPVALREIMAQCLRHIYRGDPLSDGKAVLPVPPKELFDDVTVKEVMASEIRCAVYSSKRPAVGLLLYMHGGGFVIGSSEDVDYTARQICKLTGLTVVSVNYRLAPETVFPGALHDCLQALDWAIERSADLALNTSSIFLAGDSAGGNLAASLALLLKQRQRTLAGTILLAPWLDMHVEAYESFNRLAPQGIVYDAGFIGYARGVYARFEEWENPLVSPIFCNLQELPPTIVLVGAEDPLVDQSIQLSEIARDAGCNHIEFVVYEGMPHCFYSFPSLFDEEKDCYKRISLFVKQNLVDLQAKSSS